MSTSFAMNNGIHHSSPRCMWPTLAMIIVSGRVSRSCDQCGQPSQPRPRVRHITHLQCPEKMQEPAQGNSRLRIFSDVCSVDTWRWLEVAGGGQIKHSPHRSCCGPQTLFAEPRRVQCTELGWAGEGDLKIV